MDSNVSTIRNQSSYLKFNLITLKFLKEHIQHASLSAFPAENLFPSFVPPPSDHHPGNPRQTKKALGYPGEKGPRYRMKVERRCMAREHTLRGHHGRSMVDHDGGRFASLPPFFSRYRLISMHHREGTGSEAAALAQHAISERHRWTEVVDYLQHKAGWIREKMRERDSADWEFIHFHETDVDAAIKINRREGGGGRGEEGKR